MARERLFDSFVDSWKFFQEVKKTLRNEAFSMAARAHEDGDGIGRSINRRHRYIIGYHHDDTLRERWEFHVEAVPLDRELGVSSLLSHQRFPLFKVVRTTPYTRIVGLSSPHFP
jgi:galactose-1-phosphate uridylyltransferase